MRMSTICALTLCALLAVSSQSFAALMITEVVDGDLPGGLPKFVEVKNVGTSTIDMSTYSIGNYSNGGSNLGGGASTALTGSLAPGDVYVISYENNDGPIADDPESHAFYDVYGFDPDNFSQGAFTNGDDTYALFLGPATGDGSDGTLVDLYGVVGVDGSGEDWEYTDSYAYRKPTVMGPSSTFDPSQWVFGGAAALDTLDAAGHRELTSPGTHEMVPEPSSVLISLMAASAVGAVAMRRRLG